MSEKLLIGNTYSSVLDYQRKNNLSVDILLLAVRWK